jgi:hypothetical protein
MLIMIAKCRPSVETPFDDVVEDEEEEEDEKGELAKIYSTRCTPDLIVEDLSSKEVISIREAQNFHETEFPADYPSFRSNFSQLSPTHGGSFTGCYNRSFSSGIGSPDASSLTSPTSRKDDSSPISSLIKEISSTS